MYIMQQYRDTALAEQWDNAFALCYRRNLTAFPAKYPLYDVERWVKRKEQRLLLFFYRKPLISRLRSCDDLYCDPKAKKTAHFNETSGFYIITPVRFERMWR